MKKWHGMELYECPVCGFSTVDAGLYAEHLKKTGHKEEPAKTVVKAKSVPALEIPAVEPVEIEEPKEDFEAKEVKNGAKTKK